MGKTSPDPGIRPSQPPPPEPAAVRLRRLLRTIKQITLLAWDRFWIDRCTLAASSLAYQSALALVPLLAIGLALLKASGRLDAGSSLISVIVQNVFPSSPDARAEIVVRLSDFSDQIAAGALGSFGLITSTVVGFLLFISVESIWNHIWESMRERGYVERFLLFYAGITLLPFVAALSVLHTAALWGGNALLRITLSLLSTAGVLTIANRLVPTVRVEWRAALWGGITSAIMLELAKAGLGFYLAWVTGSYKSIYGALGVVPLFLLSIYVLWMIILWGVEVCHAVQRLPLLHPAPDGSVREPSPDDRPLTGPLAARLLRDLAQAFVAGRKGVALLELERRHNLPEVTVRRLFRRLLDRDLVVEQPIDRREGFMLARPPERITLDEILRLFQPVTPPGPQLSGDAFAPEGPEADTLARVLRELDVSMQRKTQPITLAMLVDDTAQVKLTPAIEPAEPAQGKRTPAI